MQNKSNVVKRDLLKYEIATELGLLEKLVENGWGGLSAQETGKIGGILARRLNQGDAISLEKTLLMKQQKLKE